MCNGSDEILDLDLNGKEITQKITEIRKKGNVIINNCYINFMTYPIHKITNCIVGENTICVVVIDEEINRLYTCSRDKDELSYIIRTRSDLCNSVVEIVSREREDQRKLIADCGLVLLSSLLRVACDDISVDKIQGLIKKSDDYGDSKTALAEECDAKEILEILQREFDQRISHIGSIDSIREAINNEQFIIVRDSENRIVSLLQKHEMPRKYYINQIINRGCKSSFYEMVYNSIKQY